MSVLKRIITSLRFDGLRITVPKLYALVVDHLFDIRYGIDTCTCSELAELTISSGNREKGRRYQATRVMPLRKLFRAIKPLIPADSVIVDLGCGKGRVLLIALEFGFREVRGLEFAHELCEIAKTNSAVYKTKRGFSTESRIIECDVVNYTINTDENVFFMFNPFDEAILTKVLCNIAASLQIQPRPILIIYYNPKYGHIIEQTDAFDKQREFNFLSHKFTVYSNRNLTNSGSHKALHSDGNSATIHCRR